MYHLGLVLLLGIKAMGTSDSGAGWGGGAGGRQSLQALSVMGQV